MLAHKRSYITGGLICLIILLCLLTCILSGFWKKGLLNQKNPITITIWHTYVEDMRIAFDELIRDFNQTVGAEKGVIVKVTSITDATVINEHMIAAANNDPGAPDMPNLAVIYPQIAVTLAEKGVLVDLGRHFSREELETFVPQFVEEGRLGGEQLYLLPIAKSAEVLYVNRTIFDRFSKDSGVSVEMLATFEGIARAAEMYYKWSGGKSFFYPEGLFNQAMVGFQQLGGNIVNNDQTLNLSDSIFKRIWDCYYAPAVKGGTAIYDGWGNYLAATGDVVCSTASSAGATFYLPQIIYPDATKKDVEYDVLPYPVFAEGKNVVYQRGGGFCVTKSNEAKEYAACLFLSWLVEAERNLAFCASIGYMPVRKSSFDEIMAGNFPVIKIPIAKKTLLAVAAMQKNYDFYFPPVFDGFSRLQTQYADRLRTVARESRVEYLRLLETQEPETAFDNVSNNVMDDFISKFNP